MTKQLYWQFVLVLFQKKTQITRINADSIACNPCNPYNPCLKFVEELNCCEVNG